MNKLLTAAIALLAASPALAQGEIKEAGGLSLLTVLFLAFVALIFLFQLIPAIMLLGSMIKGIFVKTVGAKNEFPPR